MKKLLRVFELSLQYSLWANGKRESCNMLCYSHSCQCSAPFFIFKKISTCITSMMGFRLSRKSHHCSLTRFTRTKTQHLIIIIITIIRLQIPLHSTIPYDDHHHHFSWKKSWKRIPTQHTYKHNSLKENSCCSLMAFFLHAR